MMSQRHATLCRIMDELFDEAEATLRTLVGGDARFRHDQWEAIQALVAQRRRVLVVQRTGWGKSAVYFVATALLRRRGAGPTLLVSPLLSLMRNQIDAAQRGGIRTHRITSDNTTEWEHVTDLLRRDEVDVLLVSPERFANAAFRRDVLPIVTERAGLLVIDEAHCISDWGHDFRPDYRRLARVLDLLPEGVPVLCTTATANDRVVGDIVDQLGGDLLVLRGPLDRESLALDVLQLPRQAERMAWLAEQIPKLPGTGIVYTLTVADAERVADWLRTRGIEARSYSGRADSESRLEVERRLLANEIKCVVATSALGMGFDKPDLSFVVHYQIPGSAIALYQQIGRAGRALDHAYAIGLAGDEDRRIQNWFIDTAFPTREHVDQILTTLDERADWVRLGELESSVNLRRTRLLGAMKILEVEGAVEANGQKWRRTLRPWTYPTERVAAVTARRHDEQARMHEFLHTDQCLMRFLLRELDERDASPCGRCARCLGHHLIAPDVDAAVVGDAVRFLRGPVRRDRASPARCAEGRADRTRAHPVHVRRQWLGCRRPRRQGGGHLLGHPRTSDGRARPVMGARPASRMDHMRPVAAPPRARAIARGTHRASTRTALSPGGTEGAPDRAPEADGELGTATAQRRRRVRDRPGRFQRGRCS